MTLSVSIQLHFANYFKEKPEDSNTNICLVILPEILTGLF